MSVERTRIGILTLHYGFNEGAVLQAYSTAKLLQDLFPDAEVEIVDQRYPSKLSVYGPANDEKRVGALQHAIDTWLPLSPLRTRSADSSSVKLQLTKRYNLLIYGSDQIWDLRYRRRFRRVFGGVLPFQDSPFHPAFPNVYWPDANLRIPQVVFAASVGALSWLDIPRRHLNLMRYGLRACDLIGVRDLKTLQFLEYLSADVAKRAVLVADPTFCEWFHGELYCEQAIGELKSRLISLGVDFSRPRCGFVCGENSATRDAALALRASGVQTIAISTKNEYCDVSLFEAGFHPLDWARIFGFMSFCISERMHACICCLLQRVPFAAIDINETEGNVETKLTSLMRSFGVTRYYFRRRSLSYEGMIQACRELQSTPWDWESIEATRQKMASDQRAFLEQARGALNGTSGPTLRADPDPIHDSRFAF